MQSVILIGNLARDVELITIHSGITKANCAIAVKRPHTKDDTDFFNIVAWRATAENLAKYCSKGSRVALKGYFTNRSYEANDGSKRYVFEFNVEEMEFLSAKREQSDFTNDIVSDDDLPF